MPHDNLKPLPPFLQNPVIIAESERLQKELRAKWLASAQGRGRKTRAQKEMEYAIRCEEAVRGNLAVAMMEHHNGTDRTEEINACRDSLSEYLYKQGRFKEASQIASSDVKKDEAEAMLAAINRADDANCNCNDFESHTGAKNQRMNVPQRFVCDEVYSDKHKSFVKVWKCVCCGFMNATPELPYELEKLEKVKEQAFRKPTSIEDIEQMRKKLRDSGNNPEGLFRG